jgi:hypothetical protein
MDICLAALTANAAFFYGLMVCVYIRVRRKG